MIEFNLFGILIFLISISIEIILLAKKKIRKIDILAHTTFIVYIVVLTKIVFFPIPFQSEAISIMKEVNGELTYNFIPFHSINEILETHNIRNIVFQLAGNLILLLPMGFYLSVILSKGKAMKNVFCIIIVSISIEFIQLLIGMAVGFQYRIVDIDDVILNTIGGIVGSAMGIMFRPLYEKLCKAISDEY